MDQKDSLHHLIVNWTVLINWVMEVKGHFQINSKLSLDLVYYLEMEAIQGLE
jgi:hypothetical protein